MKNQVCAVCILIASMFVSVTHAQVGRSINVDGVNFTLDPPTIEMTMVDGQGDKAFSVTIRPSIPTDSYGFSRYGYGDGLPTYAILGISSGGALGNQTLNLSFTDSVLNADGANPKVFNAQLPIHIYHGSERGGEGEDRFLFLQIKLTVVPTAGKAPEPIGAIGADYSSRKPDTIIGPGKHTLAVLDVWSQGAPGKNISTRPVELLSFVCEFFLFHNPPNTSEVRPAAGTIADITDIRFENTEGQTIAVGSVKTVLPPSFLEVAYPTFTTQVVIDMVKPQPQFAETLFLTAVLGNKFVTDDIVAFGVHKIVFKDDLGAIRTFEPYNEAFLSWGSRFVRPRLIVSTDPSTPTSVPANGDVVGARFKVAAESVAPPSKILWRAWQLRFEVSSGVASSLGKIKVFNEAKELVKEQEIIPLGNNPRQGLVFLEEQDDGVSGYSLKSEETFTITFSTAKLVGALITVRSEDFSVADLGFGGQYGGLVSYNAEVKATVRVQEPVLVIRDIPLPYSGTIKIPEYRMANDCYNGGELVFAFVLLSQPIPKGTTSIVWRTDRPGGQNVTVPVSRSTDPLLVVLEKLFYYDGAGMLLPLRFNPARVGVSQVKELLNVPVTLQFVRTVAEYE